MTARYYFEFISGRTSHNSTNFGSMRVSITSSSTSPSSKDDTLSISGKTNITTNHKIYADETLMWTVSKGNNSYSYKLLAKDYGSRGYFEVDIGPSLSTAQVSANYRILVEYTYAVEYNYNDGSGKTNSVSKTSTTSTYDMPISLEIEREGYILMGWALSENSSAPDYVNGDAVSMKGADSTLKLYAVWKKAAPPFKIKMNGIWIEASKVCVKSNGLWFDSSTAFVNIDGSWNEII